MTRDYIIIVAGGKGLRMESDIPKQFLPIMGTPVLMRTMKRFHDYSNKLQIILVLPESQQEYWTGLCKSHSFDIPYTLATGGPTRFHSVKNGLDMIPADAEGTVGVHDGVRPFPDIEVIRRCYDAARTTGAAIPVTPVVETLRHITSGTADRSAYRLVQTPQVFTVDVLRKAYMQEYTETFTDDASVVEHAGHRVTMIDGNRENIKITTPFDIAVAEAIIKKASSTH
ncbi:2-C-methyl-D-erythritol 4-phosphate cytidylyltransferase [Xylanibacter muris]|uniref:2-C-methyl-D-erythritol 4-phosphate cytidylyltransferase n=1 Tax=Xylanibacter muris TaxID=2736290 RepID=A0ABX2AM29_9BACT|nr:2-C-methyl-D-erythritol 4-phosphate cytidylyltransferase [Xylanibacter muris]NPD91830.1 2-C-methyl-D-erythritol 4-phosphate cytidylyltransferase [Xylanibacter muris]